jgi:predicted GTPase
MAGMKEVTNVWKNLREVDLRPIREAALKPIKIALVGAPGSGRHTLAGQMRIDPSRPQMQSQTPLMIGDLKDLDWIEGADLIVLVIEATSKNTSREQELARGWVDSGKKFWYS